jgi:hypothetical protein
MVAVVVIWINDGVGEALLAALVAAVELDLTLAEAVDIAAEELASGVPT